MVTTHVSALIPMDASLVLKGKWELLYSYTWIYVEDKILYSCPKFCLATYAHFFMNQRAITILVCKDVKFLLLRIDVIFLEFRSQAKRYIQSVILIWLIMSSVIRTIILCSGYETLDYILMGPICLWYVKKEKCDYKKYTWISVLYLCFISVYTISTFTPNFFKQWCKLGVKLLPGKGRKTFNSWINIWGLVSQGLNPWQC